MKNFNGINQTAKTTEDTLLRKYSGAVSNILWILAFTAINLIFLFTNSNTYFLFSAYIPYGAVDLGMYLCGRYPQEAYGADYANMTFLGNGFFALTIAIAVIVLVIYLLSYIFARKGKVGWLIFSVVFFIVDFLALIAMCGFSTELIFDYVFHIWVIFGLISGITAHFNLKKMKEQGDLPEAVPVAEEDLPVTEENNENNEVEHYEDN